MATYRKPSKPWSALSPAYQKRMSRAGLTSRNWTTAKGAQLRTAARGHATTPERPTRAEKNPDRYPAYVSRRSDEQRQLEARKEQMFGSLITYNPRRSINASKVNPMYKDGNASQIRPRTDYLRRFLRMSYDDVLAIDWSDDDWGFLFYH